MEEITSRQTETSGRGQPKRRSPVHSFQESERSEQAQNSLRILALEEEDTGNRLVAQNFVVEELQGCKHIVLGTAYLEHIVAILGHQVAIVTFSR